MLGRVTATTQRSAERLTDFDAVRGYVKRVCFKTGPPLLVGTELEWLVAFEDRPGDVVPLDLLRDLLGAVTAESPLASSLTFEPGGQLELSSPAVPGPSACWRVLDADVARVRAALAAAGLALLPTAVDPLRRPLRQLRHPRYDAMARYFAAAGPDDAVFGPVMMTSTAATQVNLDVGDSPDEVARRWRLLHDVGPVLVAAFANSPTHAGAATGWRSTRQRVWQSLDPSRTAAPTGADPVDAWTAYALDARLMMLPRAGEDWSLAPGPTFRDWVEGRLDAAPPTEDDLAYHLTTLFPPVRPQGLVRGPLRRRAARAVVAGAGRRAGRAARRPGRPARSRWRPAPAPPTAGPTRPGTASTTPTWPPRRPRLLRRRRRRAAAAGRRPGAGRPGRRLRRPLRPGRGRCPADDPLTLEAP